MRRGVRCLAAAVMVVAATGCNFTESEEIARPDDSVATTASSATTTSGVPSGAKPLVALADGAQPKPGATVDVTTVKQLQAQLVSKQTAADLPAADGRYDLTGRAIVAPQPVIDGLVDDGRLSDAITADVAFVDVLEDEAGTKPEATKPNGAKGGPSSSTAPGSNGTVDKPAASARAGSMLIGETGPVRLVVAGSADCCGFALVRERDAFSVEVTASAQGPKSLHVVAVTGVDPFAKVAKRDKYVPPAATAKPIGKVAIPDMTVKLPATPRPPGVTDPPADPDKRASVELPPPAPPGSWCGYLAMRAVPFDEMVVIWNQLGRPAHMDADGNGIPCETRY